jgi:PKD repeat protein
MAFTRSAARRLLFLVAACLSSLLLFAGTAAAIPPTASTQPATAVTDNSAVLNGIVNPGGEPTSVHFVYGPVGGGTSQTPDQSVGDGTTDTLASAQVGGLTPNTTYHVEVVASNSSPSVPDSGQNFTTAPAPPPTAAFSPDSATVLAGSAVSFDGTRSSDRDGSITSYSWNFGDGGTSTASQPSHSYAKAGTYTVGLTVTDNFGNSSSTSHQISVIVPPPLQTLIETIAPYPTILRSGAPPSISSKGMFDLGERLFCPGSGPACRTTVIAKRGSSSGPLAGGTVLSTPADSSAEIGFKLKKSAFKRFRTNRRLRLALTMVSHRGGESVTTHLNVLLKLLKG